MSDTLQKLIEALQKWKCPSCGGSGVYEKFGHRNHPDRRQHPMHEVVPCKICGGYGLHPTARTALTDAGVTLKLATPKKAK